MLLQNPKLFAAYVPAQFIRYFKNWRAGWAAYRKSAPLPVFQFRNGIVLHHGPSDDPVLLLHEVIIGGCYRRYLKRPVRGTVLDIGAREILRKNIEVNRLDDRIKLHDQAVGRAPGQITLHLNAALPGPVALLKIDTEGAEGDILEGASRETLAQIDQVILEYHENFCPGVARRCASKLESAGFRCDVHAIAPEQGLIYACRA
jgi:hypothetical protein